MSLSRIITAIFAALYDVLGKVSQFLVTMAVSAFDLLVIMEPFLRMVILTIMLFPNVLVWVLIHVEDFIIDVIPVLLTAGFPTIAPRRFKDFPNTLVEMLIDRPCPPHGTADFMTYLIDNDYSTAPFQFCLWLSEFALRGPDNLSFGWGPMQQREADTLFAFASREGYERFFSDVGQEAIIPWEMYLQPPPVSILSDDFQAEAASMTHYLYSTRGLYSPFGNDSHSRHAEELQIVLATFFAHSAPLQLRVLSDVDVSTLLVSLQVTTHFTVFLAVYNACLLFNAGKFNEFNRQVKSMDVNYRVGSVLRLGITIGLLAIMMSIALVQMNVSIAFLLLPELGIFVGSLITIYALHRPCCADHGFSHADVRSWEVFLSSEDYVSRRKEAGFFVGIARKRSLMSTPWSPEHTTRIFLWNNLCLTLGEMFENTVGEAYAVLFDDDHLVNRFHHYLHEKFEKELWVEKPAIYQLHTMVFYGAAFLSLFPTALCSAFFLFFHLKLVTG